MNKAVCSKKCGDSAIPARIPPEVLEPLMTIGGLEGLSNQIMPRNAIIKNVSLFKALSDPFRIKILSMLSFQPLCVCIIRELLEISDTRLSYHLKKLSTMGLIQGASQGNWIIYELTDLGVKALSLCLEEKNTKR
ncbi:MAG: winged helix-turn-helix transcriptional regulator [Methanomicrobiales archaeon]|nr:winged helix-turn-helix transcriptional regulator [Methanomicrobiales archaeon]